MLKASLRTRILIASIGSLALFIPAAARAQTVTLTINMTGSGTVAVIPSGALCTSPASTQCVYDFPVNTAVRLSSNVPAGVNFPGKYSAGTGSAAACGLSTCSFTITTNSSLTATFSAANVPISRLTMVLAGDGTGEIGADNSRCQNFDPALSGSCGTDYMTGSVVSIGATAAAGSRFSGYSAGTNGAAACNGSPALCSFTLGANSSITGTYHALTSIAVSPASSSRHVTEDQVFTANGTYSNSVTEPIAIGMGTWTTKAAITPPRFSLGAAAAAGRIFAIGGNDSAAPKALVDAYDPGLNAWTPVAQMIAPREGFGAVTVNGQIYAVGGNTTGSNPIAAVERYDPTGNNWTSRAPLPAPRRFLAAGVVNGIIYAVGGETAGGVVGTVEAYDPGLNTWTAKAPMPTARRFLGVGVVNGILYAVGGDDSGPALTTVEAYDPATNAWTTKAPLPSGSTTLAVAVVGDALYAIGGFAGGNALSSVLQYDAVRDAWGFKNFLPTARSEAAAAALDGLIYAIGGNPTSGPPLNKVEAFLENITWSSTTPSVAAVNQQGRAIAAAPGTTDVVASVGGTQCTIGSTCGRLTVTTPPTMTLDKTALTFAATSNGASFTAQTQGQIVRLTQSGTGTVAWTATPSQPWLTVSPPSGTGTATLTVGVIFAQSLPVSGGVNGLVNLAFTGASTSSAAVATALNIVPIGASTAPTGTFETPLDNATGLVGSIAVTGWAVDDVEVTGVRILRAPVAGETPGQLVFIGDAVFIDGARPDVAQTFPASPRNTRAGWGYLLLTNFLPNLGNGTFTLYAYADDADGHATLLGTRTIACSNGVSTEPFGAIDTPGQGQTINGSGYINFGWVLSRGTRRADPPGGGAVVAFIDGLAAGSPGGWVARPDLTALFPQAQFDGVDNALGFFIFDTTALANGLHTIAWLVTDNQGSAAGVGSRFFNVSNGVSGVTARFVAASAASSARVDATPILGRRGFNLAAPLRAYEADASGRITVHGEELDRFELRVGADAGYLRVAETFAPLPAGSQIDAATGIFTWQPGPGFVGAYDLRFVRSGSGGVAARDVRIVLHPGGSHRVGPQVVIDTPSAHAEAAQPFVVAGWAVDPDSEAGTGIDTLHVWAYPTRGGGPIFLGATAYGGRRPDVAAIFGDRFRDSGYGIIVHGLPADTYDLAVFAWSSAANGFVPAKTVRVTVR